MGFLGNGQGVGLFRLGQIHTSVHSVPRSKWPKIARFSRETQPQGGGQHGSPVELELTLGRGIGAPLSPEPMPRPRVNSNLHPEERGAGAHRSEIDDSKIIVTIGVS